MSDGNDKPIGMGWRSAHGEAASHGRIIVSETPEVDELPSATASDTDRSDRGPDGRFTAGNTAAAAKRIKTGPGGALAKLMKDGDEHAQAAMRWARRYGSHRRAELSESYGQISSGVGVLVESAALLLGHARYYQALSIAKGDPELAKLASTLLSQARGHERDALAMAHHEASARTKNAGRLSLPEVNT